MLELYSKLLKQKLTLSCLFSAFIVSTLCFFFFPRWETNDDVFMSMIAHGFGAMEKGSPNLFFSNVLWGYIVRAIPSIGGVLGYSIATLLAVFLGVWSIVYFLLYLNVGYLCAFLIGSLISIRPILFPQFTITAGLLSVASLIGFYVCFKNESKVLLIVSFILLFLAYLIRKEELILIFGVGIPLIFVSFIRCRKFQKPFLLLLLIAIPSIEMIDRFSYQDQNWTYVKDFLKGIGPIVNSGKGAVLKKESQLLKEFQFSVNDISLVENWFFGDPEIVAPRKLINMLSAIRQDNSLSIKWGLDALRGLKKMNPLFGLSVILFFVFLNLRLSIMWAMLVLSVFALGSIGAYDHARVFIPIQFLAVIGPFCFSNFKKNPKQHYLVIFILFWATGAEFIKYRNDSLYFKKRIIEIKKDSSKLPREAFLNWGAALPVEDLYHVLSNDIEVRKLSLISLGWGTWFPNSLSKRLFESSTNLKSLLMSEQGVALVAFDKEIPLLATYCQERLNRSLIILQETKTNFFTIRKVRCGNPVN